MKAKTNLLFSDIRILQKLFSEDMLMPAIIDDKNQIDYDILYVKNFHKFEESKLLVCTEKTSNKPLETYAHFDTIIDFENGNHFGTAFKSKTFHYINNPNQSMRWIYPEDITRPSFLNFYNASTVRAKMIAKSIETAFALGLKTQIASGSFTVHYKNELAIHSLLKKSTYDHFSIFTGTSGVNRTLLAEINTKGKSTHFLKIGLNTQTSALIKNEHQNLAVLAQFRFKHFSIPKSELINVHTQLINNVRTANSSRTNEFGAMHCNALEEMYDKTSEKKQLPYSILKERYEYLNSNIRRPHKLKQSNHIARNLKKLITSIPEETNIPVARAHYDFTPWNMFVDKNCLHIYDWELSIQNMPVLFDVFHFVFQKSILIEQKKAAQILDELDVIFQQDYMQKMIQKYNVDTSLHLKLYLIEIAAYYTSIYQRNKTNSPQELWQINCWNELLQEMVNHTDLNEQMPRMKHQNLDQRHHFIHFFCSRLVHFPHAFLKLRDIHPLQLPESADLDILIQEKDMKQLVKYVSNHENVKDYKAYHKSFMTTLEINFDDDSFLVIDLIHDFRRKDLVYLDAKRLLKSRNTNTKNIMVPDAHHDFEYCFLFYLLNNASIPERYVRFFKEKDAIENNYISKHIASRYKIKTLSFEDLCHFSNEKKAAILKQIKSDKNNRFSKRLKHTAAYIKDSMVDFKQRKGFMITFSGVDGAGKSTIIEEVREQLSEKYRKNVVVLRHRPGLLPIISAWKYGKDKAEKRTVSRLPRTGNNKNKLSSLLRFMYYYSDYVFGQSYIYFRYILRGYIVLYDRYYFDFINDAKRSNIQLNRTFIKRLYALVYKPRFNYFLYADPEIIYSHKTSKYYLYPTSDGFTGWSGTYFKTFSSPDLVNWTDEGVIVDLKKLSY